MSGDRKSGQSDNESRGDFKSVDIKRSETDRSDSKENLSASIHLEDQISQHHLAKRMGQFLEFFQESIPPWALRGLCNAYGFLMLRADAIGERDKYIQRLQFLAQADYGQMQKMFYLYKGYRIRFQYLLEQQLPELNKQLAPYQEKLTPLKKRFLELKQEFDDGKSNGVELAALRKERAILENKITEIRSPFYAAIEKQATADIGGVRNKEWLQSAQEIYFFINATLSLFDPGQYLKLRAQENKEAVVSTRDYLDFLKLLPPDALEDKKPISQAFSFQFNFTEKELAETIQKTVHDGDMIIIESPDHIMYLTKNKENYFLYDPNSNDKPLTRTFAQVASDIRKGCFTDMGENSDYLPVGLMIFEKTQHHISRPSSTEVLADILKNRGGDKHINEQGCQQTTALWMATRAGNIEIVRDLLEKWGADPNIADNEGSTPAMEAAYHGEIEILKLLVAHKADINKTSHDGSSLVMRAAFNGHVEIINLLGELKADMDKINYDKCTALMIASRRNHLESIRALADNKADLNKTIQDAFIPIHLAAHFNNTEVIKTLVECKADINITDNNGYTAAVVAVQQNRINALKMLVKCNADLNKMADDGRSPLAEALNRGNTEIVNFLVENGAHFDFIANNMPRMIIKFFLSIKDPSFVTPALQKALTPYFDTLLETTFTILNEMTDDPRNRKELINETIQQKNALGTLFHQPIDLSLFGKKVAPLQKLTEHFNKENQASNTPRGAP